MKKNCKDDKFFSQTLTHMVIVVIIFLVISYVFFAIIPEYTGFSFPTGGWDWLSFIGSLVGMIIASWGVSFTIESSNKSVKEETCKAVRPILNISVINNYEFKFPLTINGVYIPYSVSNGTIKIEENFYFLSNITHKFSDSSLSLLQIRNIGLGSAMDVHIKIYKIDKIFDQEPENYNPKSVEDFYNGIKLNENAESLVYNTIHEETENFVTSEFFYEIQPFHLNNNTETFNILMGQRGFSGKTAFYILNITYSDMYGEKKYQQYQHICFADNQCKYFSTSSQKYLETKIKEKNI